MDDRAGRMTIIASNRDGWMHIQPAIRRSRKQRLERVQHRGDRIPLGRTGLERAVNRCLELRGR
jgi:hypothetical protein